MKYIINMDYLEEALKNKTPKYMHNDIINILTEVEKTEFPIRGNWEERYVEDSHPIFRKRFYCSRCGNWTTHGKSKYCPNCGAFMREEEDNENR